MQQRNIKNKRHSLSDEHGTLAIETLMCLPLILMLAFSIIQFAFLALCRQMVVYASFVAARATLVVNADEEEEAALYAARVVCSTISFVGEDTTASGENSTASSKPTWLSENYPNGINGYGGISGEPQKEGARFCIGKLAVEVSKQPWYREVTVYMDVPLLFGGWILKGMSDSDFTAACYGGYPHVRLRHTTVIGKNNVVLSANNLPTGYNVN